MVKYRSSLARNKKSRIKGRKRRLVAGPVSTTVARGKVNTTVSASTTVLMPNPDFGIVFTDDTLFGEEYGQSSIDDLLYVNSRGKAESSCGEVVLNSMNAVNHDASGLETLIRELVREELSLPRNDDSMSIEMHSRGNASNQPLINSCVPFAAELVENDFNGRLERQIPCQGSSTVPPPTPSLVSTSSAAMVRDGFSDPIPQFDDLIDIKDNLPDFKFFDAGEDLPARGTVETTSQATASISSSVDGFPTTSANSTGCSTFGIVERFPTVSSAVNSGAAPKCVKKGRKHKCAICCSVIAEDDMPQHLKSHEMSIAAEALRPRRHSLTSKTFPCTKCFFRASNTTELSEHLEQHEDEEYRYDRDGPRKSSCTARPTISLESAADPAVVHVPYLNYQPSQPPQLSSRVGLTNDTQSIQAPHVPATQQVCFTSRSKSPSSAIPASVSQSSVLSPTERLIEANVVMSNQVVRMSHPPSSTVSNPRLVTQTLSNQWTSLQPVPFKTTYSTTGACSMPYSGIRNPVSNIPPATILLLNTTAEPCSVGTNSAPSFSQAVNSIGAVAYSTAPLPAQFVSHVNGNHVTAKASESHYRAGNIIPSFPQNTNLVAKPFEKEQCTSLNAVICSSVDTRFTTPANIPLNVSECNSNRPQISANLKTPTTLKVTDLTPWSSKDPNSSSAVLIPYTPPPYPRSLTSNVTAPKQLTNRPGEPFQNSAVIADAVDPCDPHEPEPIQLDHDRSKERVEANNLRENNARFPYCSGTIQSKYPGDNFSSSVQLSTVQERPLICTTIQEEAVGDSETTNPRGGRRTPSNSSGDDSSDSEESTTGDPKGQSSALRPGGPESMQNPARNVTEEVIDESSDSGESTMVDPNYVPPPRERLPVKTPDSVLKEIPHFEHSDRTKFVVVDSDPETPRPGNNCYVCGVNFETHELLKEHREQRYSELECCKCMFTTVTVALLKEHVSKHAQQKPYTCDECGIGFTKRWGYVQHFLAHRGDYYYKCDGCGQGFYDYKRYEAHINKERNIMPYKCLKCHVSFPAKLNLQIHRRRQHKLKAVTQCTVCKKNIRKQSLADHMKFHERGREEKKCLCEHCGKCFKTNKALGKHKVIHSSFRQYVCTYCGDSFKVPGVLKQHERKHTGERPFKCDECGKTFAFLTPYRYHLRIHTGERPYTCEYCGLTFAQPSPYAVHKRLHTGERPYSCRVCPETFASHASVRNHMRTHANTGNEKRKKRTRTTKANIENEENDEPMARPNKQRKRRSKVDDSEEHSEDTDEDSSRPPRRSGRKTKCTISFEENEDASDAEYGLGVLSRIFS